MPTTTNEDFPSPDFRALFDVLPGLYLVIRPNDPDFTIVAVNRAYAEATMTDPSAIVGRGLFEVFPDNPDDPNASGVKNLHASLRRVLETKGRDTMAAQRYDIRQPGGRFEERHWSTMNSPLFDELGEIQFIIHRVEDVTELLRLRKLETDHGRLAEDLRQRTDHIETELFLRARQLSESQRLLREREEVEKKLRATEARYSLAFAQAPIGMVLLTPEGRVVEANQAFVDMLGFSQEELTSATSVMYTHPDDVAPTQEFFARLRNGPESTVSFEKRYRRKSGEILWARASGTMRRDDHGTPTQVIAIVENITERKRVEARYRFLAESIPQMVWTARPDGAVDYLNRRGTSYFGVGQEAPLGDGWLEWVHPAEREETVKRWKHCLATGEPYETAFRLLRNDGTWRWHLVRAVAFGGESGAVAAWFGTCTDIEDQKQADVKLHQQWQTFDTALTHTPDFIYTFDLAGRFTYVNRALLSLWGKSLEEAQGKNFFELEYPPELAARLQLQIQQVIETKQALRDETPFTGADGEARHYDYIFVPVLDADGRVKAVAGSTRDITEQNLAARQIEEDRRRWRELMRQTPAGIALMQGPEHRFEWANPDFGRLAGRPAETLVGRTVREVFPEIEAQIYMDLLNRVYQTGEPFSGHEMLLRLQRSAGAALDDLYVNFVYLPIRDAAGEIDGIFCHVTDVTEGVTARKRIEASEERFRLAFQAVEGIVYDWDPKTGAVLRNGNLEKMIGVTVAEAKPTEHWWQERVHPEDQAKSSFTRLPALGPRQDHFETEFRFLHADGHWVYLCDRGYIVHDEKGTVVRVVGSTHDVTEERTLMNALKQSETRFRQAIDSMPQIVWSTGSDGRIDLYNKQWFEYTGLPSNAGNREDNGVIHSDDLQPAWERWELSRSTGEPYEMEMRLRRFDGVHRWFLVRATPIRDDNGEIVRWFGTSTDIEDRKKAEMAVVSKQKLESLGLLAGGIAHDFNNLLVGVLGGASYAAEALPETHELQPVLGGIIAGGERAAHLTRQMLAYAGKGRFLVESVDIGELVVSTCGLIRGSIPKHVHLVLNIDEGLPPVEADSGQMQQIVMNLIINAAESIDQDRRGLVVVRATVTSLDAAAIARIEVLSGSLVPGHYLVFEVEDNGSGIDRETQARMFDPFFTTKFTGRGLGLSAVHGILRAHNGALELKSIPAEGSHFRVYLPASGEPVYAVPPVRDPERRGVGTVLVVDDESIVRTTAQASLRRAGFHVMLAETGEQAMVMLQDRKTAGIDVILLDMSMPGMSGKDVMERIRQLGIDVPVLICSGYSEGEVYREFSGLDIAGFIQKPFRAGDLAAKIKGSIRDK